MIYLALFGWLTAAGTAWLALWQNRRYVRRLESKDNVIHILRGENERLRDTVIAWRSEARSLQLTLDRYQRKRDANGRFRGEK